MSRNEKWDHAMGCVLAAIFVAAVLLFVFASASRGEQPVVTCDTVRGIVRAHPDKSLDQLAALYHLNSSEVDLAMACLSHPGPRAVKTEKVHAPRQSAGVRADPYDTDGHRRTSRAVAVPLPRPPVLGDVGNGGPPAAKVPVVIGPNEPAPDQQDHGTADRGDRVPPAVVTPDVQHHDEPPAEPVRKVKGWRAMSLQVLLLVLAGILGWEASKLGFKGVVALAKSAAVRFKAASPDVLAGVANDVKALVQNHSLLASAVDGVRDRITKMDDEFHARISKLEHPTPQPAEAAPANPAAPA